MTFAVILFALLLVGLMRRLVALLLRRSTPQRIDRVTFLLQVAVLVGELAFIMRFIGPGWLVLLLASLVSILAAIMLFPGNPLGHSAAFLRMPNRLISSAPVVIQRAPIPQTIDDSLLASAMTGMTNVDEAQVLPIGSVVHVVETQWGKTAPLVKRSVLGKISVKLLLPQ